MRPAPARGARLAGRLGLLAALLAATPGCNSWRASSAGAGGISALSSKQVRLMLRDGSTVVLSSPYVRGDSIVGMAHPGDGEPVRFAAATDDVVLVETRGFSAGRTAGAVLVGAATLAALSLGLILVALAGADF